MGIRVDEVGGHGTEHADPIPEIRPWREAGGIFTDGDALAIERQEDRTRARSARGPDPLDG